MTRIMVPLWRGCEGDVQQASSIGLAQSAWKRTS
jgi:hypothetical protein